MNFKELRRSMIVLANTIYSMPSSRELSAARTSMQKTMMWSGNYLKHSGTGESPYANPVAGRTKASQIEPMFEPTSDILPKEIMREGTIFTVDKMRKHLGEYLDTYMTFMTEEEKSKEMINYTTAQVIHTNLCLVNIYNNLTEARMWLGMELGRLRDQAA